MATSAVKLLLCTRPPVKLPIETVALKLSASTVLQVKSPMARFSSMLSAVMVSLLSNSTSPMAEVMESFLKWKVSASGTDKTNSGSGSLLKSQLAGTL